MRLLTAMAACVAAVACGSTDDASQGSSTSNATACGAPVATEAPSSSAEPVSFRADVMPILKQSCAFSSCHGGASSTANHGVYLGTDPATVHASVVGVAATQAPSLAYVAAGDPSRSYLMHKVDGDLCTIASSCTDSDCLSPMPKGADVMPSAKRDLLRRWIANGARND